jgi:hypothetical protein
VRFRNVSTVPLRLGLFSLAATVAQANERRSLAVPETMAQASVTRSSSADWQPVMTGRLKNGVRFAILPRRGGEPGIGVLMRNEGGFIEERRPGERGLTHLIEHLVFTSPTINAPDELRHFPKVGLPLTFPAPSAATTSWRESNYFVSTRTTRMTDLDTLLGLFREVATDLTFRADAVDDQRADVTSEMAEKTLGNDIYARYIAAVAPGSPTDVIDAQNSDDVPTASIATIRALYQRLYQPENMMIVIVGNIDPVKTKALIREHFGSWRHAGQATAHVAVPALQSDRIAPISVAALPQGRRTALMTVVMPTAPPLPTRGQQIDAMLLEMLVVRAVDTRLSAMQPDSPPGKVGLYIENGEQGHRLIMLWDNFVGNAWHPAIAGLARVRCALDSGGFSDQEWDAAQRDLIQDLDRRTSAMGQVQNVELAKDLSHAFAAGRALIPPSALLRRAQTRLPAIDAQAGNHWWRQQWRAGVRHVRVESPDLAPMAGDGSALRTSIAEASKTGCDGL